MGSWGNFSGLKNSCHTGLLRWDTGEIHLPMPSTCQGRRRWRLRFNPLVRKILRRRKWKPTPVFFPGNLMDRGDCKWTTVHGVTKSLDMTEYTRAHARARAHTHTHKVNIPTGPGPCKKHASLNNHCSMHNTMEYS